MLSGQYNVLSGQYNVLYGHHNVLCGHYNVVSGHYNKVSGHRPKWACLSEHSLMVFSIFSIALGTNGVAMARIKSDEAHEPQEGFEIPPGPL